LPEIPNTDHAHCFFLSRIIKYKKKRKEREKTREERSRGKKEIFFFPGHDRCSATRAYPAGTDVRPYANVPRDSWRTCPPHHITAPTKRRCTRAGSVPFTSRSPRLPARCAAITVSVPRMWSANNCVLPGVASLRTGRHGTECMHGRTHAFTDDAAAQRRQTHYWRTAVPWRERLPDLTACPRAGGAPPITCMRAPPRTGAVGTDALPDAGIINPGS